MPNFIQDFLEYNSGTECQKNYLRWAAIATLGVASGLRYSLQQGRIRITTNMYTILVGDQGTRKSYAKDQSRELIEAAFPDMPIGADVTTRDDLIKFLSSDVTERAYVDSDGASSTYHPVALFINEFKHFLSYNPAMMISFIVDIFDRKVFKCSTIKRGAEDVIGPCLNILACENTDWLIGSLKTGIITGGFSRRFIVIYEPENLSVVIPRPFLPKNSDELWMRMVKHLQGLHTTSRKFLWSSEGEKYFDNWYRQHKKNMPEDQIMRGFMRTKDQMLLKTCMLLDLAEEIPSYTITPSLIELGLALFAAIEPNMPKLYASAGRNELALPQQKLIELINSRGGIMDEKTVLRMTGKDLAPMEQINSINFLVNSGQLIKKAFKYPEDTGIVRTFLVTEEGVADPAVVKAMKLF